ncbi:Nucleotide-diphospho-sugar transferase domain-containing protein [Plasmodiophora brassicae]
MATSRSPDPSWRRARSPSLSSSSLSSPLLIVVVGLLLLAFVYVNVSALHRGPSYAVRPSPMPQRTGTGTQLTVTIDEHETVTDAVSPEDHPFAGGSPSVVAEQDFQVDGNATLLPDLEHLGAEAICTTEGFLGRLKAGAVLTMLVTPKALAGAGPGRDNQHTERHLRFLLRSWASLPDVDFVVMSTSCPLLVLAHEYGLPTLRSSSVSDVEAGTYRYAFQMAVTGVPSRAPLVGFANSDIWFESSLAWTATSLLKVAAERNWPNFFVVGQRTNVDLDGVIQSDTMTFDDKVAHVVRNVPRKGRLFQTDAEDYFIFTRDIPLVWDCMPPFFIGGIAFDNWLTGLANCHPLITTVDATSTLAAVHINHGKGRFQSHQSVQSFFNQKLLYENPLTRGDTSHAHWKTATGADGTIDISPAHRKIPDTKTYRSYHTCAAQRAVKPGS